MRKEGERWVWIWEVSMAMKLFLFHVVLFHVVFLFFFAGFVVVSMAMKLLFFWKPPEN